MSKKMTENRSVRFLALGIAILGLSISACGTSTPATPNVIAATQVKETVVATQIIPPATITPKPTESKSGSPIVCQTGGPEVYLIVGTERRHIADWDVFLSLGYESQQIISCGTSATLAEGAPITRLLKGSGDAVYWMENGLRRHIPDMQTFRALGYREQDIALVPDELLATWPMGTSIPTMQSVLPTSLPPTPAASSTSATQLNATLLDVLTKIQNRFQINPTQGCFGLLSPYPDYHKGLQEMTAILLTDPRAKSMSLAERQALFNKVTGFDGVRFFLGNGAATLVSLRTNRGYNVGCGSHYAPPDALHVVDNQGVIYDMGTSEGLLTQTWWVTDRWIALFRLKLDSTSGPTRWGLWQIGQNAGAWQRLMEFEFTPTPYNYATPPSIRFENGYQKMIADLDYWWADDPCEFTAAFKNTYAHNTWQMRRTYQLAGSTYQLTSSQVPTFTVNRKDTGEAVALKWQAYCSGPIK
jgi:hypothetical protein